MKELKFKLGDKLFVRENVMKKRGEACADTMYPCEVVGIDESNSGTCMPYLVRVYGYGEKQRMTTCPEFASKIAQDYYRNEIEYFYETWFTEDDLLTKKELKFDLGDKVVCKYDDEHYIGYIVGLDNESFDYNYIVRIFNDKNIKLYAHGAANKVEVIDGYVNESKSFREFWIDEKDILLLEEKSYKPTPEFKIGDMVEVKGQAGVIVGLDKDENNRLPYLIRFRTEKSEQFRCLTLFFADVIHDYYYTEVDYGFVENWECEKDMELI